MLPIIFIRQIFGGNTTRRTGAHRAHSEHLHDSRKLTAGFAIQTKHAPRVTPEHRRAGNLYAVKAAIRQHAGGNAQNAALHRCTHAWHVDDLAAALLAEYFLHRFQRIVHGNERLDALLVEQNCHRLNLCISLAAK